MKFIKYIKTVSAISVCLALLLCFSGCVKEPLKLRILIDENGSRGSEQQIVASAAVAFEEAHKGVSIVIETLPNAEDDRRLVLQRLQTEIMAGMGPDIYVLPGNSALNTPLFYDVNQAMRNGMFEDLSVYYDKDIAMDGLVPAVMDAGVVDGKRYVLPLWYDLSVACVNSAIFEQTGYSQDIFQQGYIGLMQTVTEDKNAELAADVAEFSTINTNILNIFPQLIDYDTQQVTLASEELAAFMEQYQKMRDIQESRKVFWQNRVSMSLDTFVQYADDHIDRWAVMNRALDICNLDAALANAAVAKLRGIDLDIVPLTEADGTLTADVTLWGAVGAGCENTELAYQFLAQLLSEKYQWEEYRLDEEQEIDSPNKGWPVRTQNGVAPRYKNLMSVILKQFSNSKAKLVAAELKNTEITNEDFPDLHTMIDRAQFSIPEEWTLARIVESKLNESGTGKALNVDIDAIAADFIEELQWRLAEG